jgi:hypothetical protein
MRRRGAFIAPRHSTPARPGGSLPPLCDDSNLMVFCFGKQEERRPLPNALVGSGCLRVSDNPENKRRPERVVQDGRNVQNVSSCRTIGLIDGNGAACATRESGIAHSRPRNVTQQRGHAAVGPVSHLGKSSSHHFPLCLLNPRAAAHRCEHRQIETMGVTYSFCVGGTGRRRPRGSTSGGGAAPGHDTSTSATRFAHSVAQGTKCWSLKFTAGNEVS